MSNLTILRNIEKLTYKLAFLKSKKNTDVKHITEVEQALLYWKNKLINN